MVQSSLAVLLLVVPAALAQVRLLLQNDLSANASLTSALFLSSATTGTQASTACGRYNEQLLASVDSDIRDQLNYLVFRGDLTNSSQLYIGGGGDNTTTAARPLRFNRRQTESCQVYTVGTGVSESGNCTTELPILCTNSAPPTTLSTEAPPQGSEVTTSGSNGSSFAGFRDSRSFRFLGIPFAQPPTGDLRFLAAQPYNGSYSNYTATSYGNACIQETSENSTLLVSTSEDCLYLNVYTPILPGTASGNSSSSRLLPVAYWIYGGAFTSGAASIPLYDGGNLASRGDVVVVSVNYRLGALGNMASSTLNGSQGITDQIQGLRWVQEHISAFGGDPRNVTIFGESAGAQSVLALMSSSQATDLFSQAVSQSAPWNPFFPREIYSEGIYPALLNATNCTNGADAEQLSCIQGIDPQLFVNGTLYSAMTTASIAVQTAYAQTGVLVSAVEPFLPVIGTGVVDGLTNVLIRNGQLPSAGKPFLIGNMRDEATLFVNSVPQLENPVPASNFTLQILLQSAFNPAIRSAINDNPGLFAFNSTDEDALRDLAARVQTQYVWQCPLQQMLSVAEESSLFPSVYTYVFDKGVFVGDGPPACGPTNNTSGIDRVCHSEDLLEVFSTSNVLGLPYSEDGGYNSLPFNQYVNDVWTSFFRTSNPQPNADYLQARGRSYNTTLSWSQATPFETYNQNSTTAIQLIDGPPQHSGILYPDVCQVLAAAGFIYDAVSNGTAAS